MIRQRGALVDALVIVVLMVTTLSILDDSFSDRSYLLAGLVPVVFLLAVALLVGRMQEGVWVYALVALLSFAPLGAVVALRRPGPFIVPTFETMNRVLGESFSAPTTLVSTVPPVDASGQVMLVPFLIGFLAAAPAVWLALGTRSPLAPAVPLVLAMAATIPLGVLVPDLLVGRGVGFAILVVGWAAARGRRWESLDGPRRGAAAAVVTAVVTVALTSGLVSVLVPDRNEVDRVLLKGGGDTAVVADAADSVVPRRVGRRNQLLKAVGVPDGRLLRFAALDLYNGTAWVPADESPGADGTGTFRRIGREVNPLHAGRTVGVRIRIRPGYSSDWLPMLGQLTSLDVDYTDGRTQLKDVRYNQETASALVIGGVHPRDDYTFASVLTDDSFTRRDATREASDDQRQPAGAFLDPYLRPFARDELRPLERVLLLGRYLRTHGSTRLAGSSSQAPVDLGVRLLGAKDMTASPFQYTAVMALGSSRLGVPARVVTGADPGPDGVVEHDDVTSWVELQFADGTWRTLDPRRYTGARLVAVDEEDDAVGGGAGAATFVTNQLEEAAAGRDPEIRFPKGTPVLLPEGTQLRDDLAPGEVLLRTLAGLITLALLALLGVPIAKWLRRRARRRTASWSGRYVNGWQEVLDAARDRGTPVPDTWSRVAQARALGVGLDLAREVDAAVFAPVAASVQDSRQFWDETQALRRRLLVEAGTRRRVWASVNPGSLLAGRERRRSARRSGTRPARDEDRRARSQQPAGA